MKIENENQTLATISFQNYFRMYTKLSGMTGTADTEAEEFAKIYNLDVRVIPTNRPMVRKDHDDVVYKTEREKFKAVAEEIEELHEKGQPVLVGTVSIAKSEALARFLQEARHPAQRAERQAARARGGHRRAGRPQGRGHHLHQHGRPRHRHPARRQPRDARASARSAPPSRTPTAEDGSPRDRKAHQAALDEHDKRLETALAKFEAQTAKEHEEVAGARRPVHPRHRAARVAAASTTSSAAAPAARATRAPVAVLPVARRRPDAHLRRPSASRG